jgi:hypothetical protein
MSKKSTSFYQYAISINFSLLNIPGFLKAAPFANSVILSSKRFEHLQSAVVSCDSVMNECLKDINQQSANVYKLIAEINPELSGIESYSPDWQENQLSKLWIIPESTDFANQEAVEAVAFANIVEIPL